jgi:hypothetical protein
MGAEILAAKMHKKHKRNPEFFRQMSPIHGDGTALRVAKKDHRIGNPQNQPRSDLVIYGSVEERRRHRFGHSFPCATQSNVAREVPSEKTIPLGFQAPSKVSSSKVHWMPVMP